jgi:hypothetical protein
MLKIENVNNEYLKVTSDEILTSLGSGDTTKIEIEGYYNCSGVPYKETIDLKSTNLCGLFPNQAVWKIDLKAAKNIDLPITSISVQNINTGKDLSQVVNINFSEYESLCSSGCALETLSPLYENKFKAAYNLLFQANGLSSANFDIKFCGDTLLIKGMPNGFIPTTIAYSSGLTELYSLSQSEKVIVSEDALYIKPFFYGMPNFIDGVYNIKVKVTDTRGSWKEESNCYFVDIFTKCKVSTKSILTLQSPKDVLLKESVLDMYLLYSHLINGSNCGGCNCVDMCDAYNKLVGIINGKQIKEALKTNCGC